MSFLLSLIFWSWPRDLEHLNCFLPVLLPTGCLQNAAVLPCVNSQAQVIVQKLMFAVCSQGVLSHVSAC